MGVGTRTREEVLALAPDPAAAKAGQGQAVATRWPSMGRDDVAAWGECSGSGKSPYRVSVDLPAGVARCSCPSRKFPCKHALGLMLLDSAGTVPTGQRPPWVQEWLDGRVERAAAATRRAEAPTETDPATAQRRAEQSARRRESRELSTDQGIEELRRWSLDLARSGLAAGQAQGWRGWDATAARLVDAKAKGLANRVRAAAAICAAGSQLPDWPERLLDALGGMHLLTEGWAHRDNLPEKLVQAMRTRIGFTVSSDDVLAGEHVTDTWSVLSDTVTADGPVRTRQQWALGESGRVVTLLWFAAGGAALDGGLPAGRRVTAELALHPSGRPSRATVINVSSTQPLTALEAPTSWLDALGPVTTELAEDPWAERTLVTVSGVQVLPPGDQRDPWRLRDQTGRALPLDPQAATRVAWAMLAVSGGGQLDVAAEWDGFGLRPTAVAPTGNAPVLL